MGVINSIRSLFNRNVVLINSPAQESMVMDLDYADIYKTQPNLRAVVTYLADNVAQLPIKVYRRDSDTDRTRMTGNTTAKLLSRPNPDMTRYELIRATVSDLLIYDRCVWLVLEDPEAESGWQIRPIPPTWVTSYRGGSAFAPAEIGVIAGNGSYLQTVPSSNFLLFHGYNPTDPCRQMSPIESLRQTILEQVEADTYRTQVWKNGGRMSSYITRPKDVQPWTPEQATRFRDSFKEAWTGKGVRGGGTLVLEDGMEIKSATVNAKEAQWYEAKKLSREEVAGVYHVNPALIWHTDGSTYASAKDNARALYSECLSPLIAQVTERVNAFLLPMVGEEEGIYAEFDMSAKLASSFEEQASVLYTNVGGPWMTVNEARARMNLPAIEGGDALIKPLNVSTGYEEAIGGSESGEDDEDGQEPETDGEAPQGEAERSTGASTKAEPTRIKAHPTEQDADDLVKALRSFFERQGRSILPKIGAGGEWFDYERWDRELADDLEPLLMAAASRKGAEVAKMLRSEFADARIAAYIRKMAEGRAESINRLTSQRLKRAVNGGEEEPTPREVFADLGEERSKTYGTSMAAAAVGWAALEAVRQAGPSAQGATKTWVVTSDNPRASHAAMNGETVPYGEKFSNGMEWPGSWMGDPAETCGCQCEVEITVP